MTASGPQQAFAVFLSVENFCGFIQLVMQTHLMYITCTTMKHWITANAMLNGQIQIVIFSWNCTIQKIQIATGVQIIQTITYSLDTMICFLQQMVK